MSFASSCKNCVAPKRHPGCHGDCPDYEKDKAVENKKKAYLRNHIADRYTICNSEKITNAKQLQQKKFKQNCGRGAGHK